MHIRVTRSSLEKDFAAKMYLSSCSEVDDEAKYSTTRFPVNPLAPKITKEYGRLIADLAIPSSLPRNKYTRSQQDNKNYSVKTLVFENFSSDMFVGSLPLFLYAMSLPGYPMEQLQRSRNSAVGIPGHPLFKHAQNSHILEAPVSMIVSYH
jgi:hypothetical protein